MTVDKTKPRGVPVRPAPSPAPPTSQDAPGPDPSPRPGPDPSPRPGPDPSPRPGPELEPGPEQAQGERRSPAAQLRRLLVQANRRVEALALVVQHGFSQREEALRQKKELSLELANLRDELVRSSQCSERLREEAEAERVSGAELARRLGADHAEEQRLLEERLTTSHQEEQRHLEERLRTFYQEEWDKVHQAYQLEADRCRGLLETQVEEMRTKQEALRQEQEVSHRTQLESLRQQYEASIQELKSSQDLELQTLNTTLQETQASLSERISELEQESQALSDKLRVEEERRRLLSDKTQKDAHTVYLEQELQSLTVVMEIKTSQLHQQDKKLMQMDKLMESNVKLEECLKKLQQENEDYRARMEKHTALSRQLSTEQATLQQSLQKESKVNKRLSMENEELLWKLHNGDLASPRRLSPTSPRNSASFPTAASLSPR